MRLAARMLIATMTAMLASCSFFVDTSGLSTHGGSSDAGSSEGGTTDGGGAVGCSETIADSFDTGPLGALWDTSESTGLMLSLDTTDVRSAPNALLVTQAAGVGGHANLTKSAPPGKSACCEVSQKTNAIYSTLFQLTGMGGNYRVAVGGNTLSEGYYVGGTDPGINRIVGTIPFDTDWHRVRVEAAFPESTGLGTVRVTMDGNVVLTGQIGGPSYDIRFNTILMGVTYAQGDADAHEARFDDVECAIH